MSVTITLTAGNDHNPHLTRRGSSSILPGGPLPMLTVTKNVNGSAAVSEEHRVQASEYLASYIKVPKHHIIADSPPPLFSSCSTYRLSTTDTGGSYPNRKCSECSEAKPKE